MQLVQNGDIQATIDQAPEKQGFEAVDLLVKFLHGQPIDSIDTGVESLHQGKHRQSGQEVASGGGAAVAADRLHASSHRGTAVEIAGVTKRFPGVLALDRISIGFRAGEVHAVIGENGAGKSTLMNILAGDLQPNEGEIRVDGKPVRFASPLDSRAAGIVVVYQELALCPTMSDRREYRDVGHGARGPSSRSCPARAMRAEARAAL